MYRIGVKSKWMSFDGEENVYAVITFSVCDAVTNECHNLFVVNGLPKDLEDWLAEHTSQLLREDINDVVSNHGLSIADKIDIFYDSLGDDDEEISSEQYSIVEKLDSYKQSHMLRLAFRGSDMPIVYVGLNGKHYEISCDDVKNRWVYEIDLPTFIEEYGE